MTKYSDLDNKCGLPEFDDIDIVSLVTKARTAMAKERPTSLGQLRGGSIGAIIDNQVYGVCHRKAYLRFHGIETPLPANIELMTSQGEQQEEIWLNELRYALTHGAKDLGLTIKDQTEFECTWDTMGTPGSGSPDITFWNKDDVPVLGLELKNLSKDSTAIAAHYETRPKVEHLIQSANYSLRMGDLYRNGDPLPYQLVYSSRSIWTLPKDNPNGKADKRRTAVLRGGHDINSYFGRPNSISPFHRVFSLKWEVDGTLSYFTAGYKSWKNTKLTRKSIEDYYMVVAEGIEKNNNLGPRPTTKHLDGKSNYSACGFCDYSSVCDIGDRLSTNEFKERCQLVAQKLWDERED